MDLESINKLLEEGAQSESPSHSLSTFYYIFIFFLTHDLSIFPSKNGGNSLHGGATATLVALVGAAAILSAGHSSDSGVSVEINVSYFGAVYAHVSTLSIFFNSFITFLVTCNKKKKKKKDNERNTRTSEIGFGF
ncbi:hypothetical protein JHK86_010863 [Glycine max]|nr:hypothetical protein JHK86_010863 [Glycine max]